MISQQNATPKRRPIATLPQLLHSDIIQSETGKTPTRIIAQQAHISLRTDCLALTAVASSLRLRCIPSASPNVEFNSTYIESHTPGCPHRSHPQQQPHTSRLTQRPPPPPPNPVATMHGLYHLVAPPRRELPTRPPTPPCRTRAAQSQSAETPAAPCR